jgi:hypothetical protein
MYSSQIQFEDLLERCYFVEHFTDKMFPVFLREVQFVRMLSDVSANREVAHQAVITEMTEMFPFRVQQ